jgi:hypothetical protein
MSIINTKQIDPYSGYSHDNAYIFGTKIHLYYIEFCLMGATTNEPQFMLRYNLDEKLAGFSVSSL